MLRGTPRVKSSFLQNHGRRWYYTISLFLKRKKFAQSADRNNVTLNVSIKGTRTYSSRASEYMDSLARKVTGDLDGEDLIRVIWLSGEKH